jgi:hypothetical protein
VSSSQAPIKLAVITGGHPFDVPGFHNLFRGHADIDPYLQDFDNWVHDWGQVRRQYDATLFYNMHMNQPDGPFREAIEDLHQRPQGVIILHHALLAWPELDAWAELVGLPDRSFGYHMEQTLRVEIADADHPITRGLEGWEMPEETYTMADAGPDNRILLTASHPLSLRTIGWTRQVGDAPVFCFQCGHDRRAWEHPTFREVVARGIRWAAGRLG